MHAVVIREGQLHWEERDDPVPGDTELLVAVRAAGLNAADLVQRAGFYPAPPGWPADIPGMEFAGEVVAVGRQVTLFAPGDRVMAVVGGGAQATLALVDEIPRAGRARRPVVDRRPAASPRSSPPPTTRSSARPSCRWASASWSRAPRAASGPPACSWRRRPAR